MQNLLWLQVLSVHLILVRWLVSVTPVDLSLLLSPVTEVQALDHLGKYFPYELFTESIILTLALSDHFLEVSLPAILHNDVNLQICLVYDAVVVHDDVGVVQVPQNVDLRHYLLLLLVTHLTIVQFFPYEHFAVT